MVGLHMLGAGRGEVEMGSVWTASKGPAHCPGTAIPGLEHPAAGSWFLGGSDVCAERSSTGEAGPVIGVLPCTPPRSGMPGTGWGSLLAPHQPS